MEIETTKQTYVNDFNVNVMKIERAGAELLHADGQI
jgi:hypothetical protein